MGLKKYFIKSRKGENIEAEEIFLDAEAIRTMEEKGKLERPIKSRNFILFYCFVVFCLLGLLFRTGYLQIVRGEYYQDLAWGNRLRVYPITAPRGVIYDRNQKPLVYNAPSFDLVIDIIDFLDNEEAVQENILGKISETAGTDGLEEKIDEARGKVSQLILVKDIDREAALILESVVNDWLGVRMEKNIRRQYIQSPFFTHILGYTGQVDSDDLEAHPDYFLTDQIGKMGLELQYEEILRGVYGKRQVEVNSVGKKQSLLATQPPLSGKSLILHIDGDLQLKLHQSLEEMLKKLKLRRAVGVAVDPNNGGVLALVSLPGFDNNLFSQGISSSDLNDLESDPGRPFLNRAVSGQYPSGSIIKPLIAAAALEEDIIGPWEQINCTGVINIVNKYDPSIVYSFPDWKAHGLTDIMEAIAQSCNVFFYAVGGGYGRIEGLGIGRIKEYLQYFGLGRLTGVDLPNESAGLVPDEEWKLAAYGEEWNLGDTYHAAIGQGDILVTPLQMASAVAAVANGGTLYQAQLVDEIIDLDRKTSEDISPVVLKENFVSPENMETVRKGMRETVVSGSGISLSSLPVKVAGKTGTAQFGIDQLHSWFVSFAPFEEPEISLVILVEGGGEGHTAAVPVAKEVLEWYFNSKD